MTDASGGGRGGGQEGDPGEGRRAWAARAEAELRGRAPEDLVWRTPEGIDVEPVYGPEDAEGLAHLGSWPGEPPYVRGPRTTMYTGRPWTIRQYAGFSTAEESNAFYRRALWRPASRASASPSTSPRTAATTATTRAWRATSASRAWRSTRSRT